MDQHLFWSLIEHAKAESGGDQSRQIELVEDRLRALSPEEISVFQRILDAYLEQSYGSALWNTLDAIETMGNDAIEDFLIWLIGQGQEMFATLTRHPDRLDECIEANGEWHLELLEGAADRIYEEKTGQSFWEVLNDRDEEPYVLVGWEWLRQH